MIPVQNIYYMLTYAFKVLNENGYKKIANEKFHNTADLMAEILAKGISIQLKRGLGKEYINQTDELSLLKGKINITNSIKTQSMLRNKMICVYDVFSVNSTLNRILKSTVELLIKTNISKSRKKELRNLMLFFADVKPIDLYSVNWNQQYNRNNQSYQMLISICHLVVKGLLQTNTDGERKMMDFLDEQRMSKLYEKFLLEYYKKEYPDISTSASQIKWQLDDENTSMLPVMQTDIMLAYKEKVLIIDAKYYAHTTQSYYDVTKLHSGNVYQIFTYVKNKDIELSGQCYEVSGLLLYAQTDENVLPNNSYRMSGNTISVKTLDLDCDFSEIKKQLNQIVEFHFENVDQ